MEGVESKAYITVNNSRLIKEVYRNFLARIDEAIKSKIYHKDLSWILSTDEFRYLYLELLVLTESDLLKKEGRVIRKDPGIFLFVSKGAPKYHLDRDCKY